MKQQEIIPLTGYQKLVIFLLAITQFTVILDFMIMSPLGDMLMKSMSLDPPAFSKVVSSYAYSAGISGFLTAFFADRFDRKKLLIFFYTGFIGGTFFCGLAQTYEQLIAARIITGIFGGVIGSISMAIIADIFALQQRGRVMGFIQMGFGASQVLGVPLGLYIAGKWSWEAPFLMVASLAVLIVTAILLMLRPVNAHLLVQRDKSAVMHLWHTLKERRNRIGFMATALLSIGGFMMMPFGSAFAINNLKISFKELIALSVVSGIISVVIMPLIGILSDKISKFKIFAFATVWMMVMCVVYTNLGPTPFWLVLVFNIMIMMGVMSRMVPSSALTSAVPSIEQRGSFMSINTSLQQIAGGVASTIAGMIVVQQQGKAGPLQNYDVVGYVIVVISILSIFLMYRVSKMIAQKSNQQGASKMEEVVVSEGL